MNKITLLSLLSLITISIKAMDDDMEAARTYAKSRPTRVRVNDLTNNLIFHVLNLSCNHAWGSSLEALDRGPRYTKISGISGITTKTLRAKHPDDDLKYRIAYSGKKLNMACCYVLLNHTLSSNYYFKTFFSNLKFDEKGDIERIKTDITVDGKDQMENFKKKFADTEIIYDDQTECRQVENSDDHATWSCLTCGMSYDEFAQRIREVENLKKQNL